MGPLIAISADESVLVDRQGAYIGATNPLQVASATPVFKAESAEVSVAAGSTFVSVVSFTPSTEIIVVGFNADFAALLSSAYRMRLMVDAVVVHQERLSSDTNSWTPIKLSAASGAVINIDVVHGEVGAQDVRATLNYQEV